MQRLRDRKDDTGVSIVEQIRRAVERDLDEDEKLPASAPPDTVTLNLKSDIQTRLAEYCRPFGYREITHFIEDLTFRALSKPRRATQEFLLGDLLKDGEEAAEQERKNMADEKKGKRNDKAA